MKNKQPWLFPKEECTAPALSDEPATDIGENPVWTDKKARFIMLYLKYFVYITHHGTYIDGFAGPQVERSTTDSWAAKLVLESKPPWLRNFYLCDAKRAQIQRLKELVAEQPTRDEKGRRIARSIGIYRGDFNKRIDDILADAKITEKEATFCLLDQRTFECDWATVEKIARHKQSGNKIELFYFLAIGWIERSLTAQRDMKKLARWWGRDDWARLKQPMSREELRDTIVDRLKTELGYKSVKAYPIYSRPDSGSVMYFMIHATDHPLAPGQMSRAYRNAVRPDDPYEGKQTAFDFESTFREPGSSPEVLPTPLSA